MLRKLILPLFVCIPLLAAAGNKKPTQEGVGSAGYQWNKPQTEKQDALHLTGQLKHGEVLFRECVQCHGPQGQGVAGKYPVVAEQYYTVIIKQIEDIKLRARDNPEMLPHIVKLQTAQDVADVAEYLSSLPRSKDNQKGPEDSKALSRGAGIYAKSCISCHKADGRGDTGYFYPRLTNQHYDYLVKQAFEIREGKRRNSHPDMHAAVKQMSDSDLRAAANYISRLQIKK